MLLPGARDKAVGTIQTTQQVAAVEVPHHLSGETGTKHDMNISMALQ